MAPNLFANPEPQAVEDWRQQLRDALRTPAQLVAAGLLTPAQAKAFALSCS